MNKTRLFILNTFTMGFFSLIFKTLFTWFNIFLANKIGSENIGIYSLTMAVYFTLVTFSQAGINLACCKIVSEELAKRNEAGALKTVRNCIIYGLACSIIVALLTCNFSKLISSYVLHSKISPKTVVALGFALPFISISSSISGYYQAKRKFFCVSLCQFIENIIEILLSVVAITFLPITNADEICYRLIICSFISQGISTILYVVLFINEKRKIIISAKENNTVKRMFKIIIPVSLSSHIKAILSGIKHSLIPKSLNRHPNNTTSSLSIYGTVNSMVMPVITFPVFIFSSVANVLIPEIATLKVLNNNKKIEYIFSKIFKYTLIFSILLVFVFFIFSQSIASLFYKEANVGKYICYLSFVIPFIYFDTVIDAILKGIDKQTAVVLINVSDTILCILLIYFLLPVYGEKGYIFVIYISEIFNGLLSFFVLKKSIKFKADITNSIIKPVISALVSLLVLTFLKANAFLSLMLYILIYFTFLLISGSIKLNEIKIF